MSTTTTTATTTTTTNAFKKNAAKHNKRQRSHFVDDEAGDDCDDDGCLSGDDDDEAGDGLDGFVCNDDVCVYDSDVGDKASAVPAPDVTPIRTSLPTIGGIPSMSKRKRTPASDNGDATAASAPVTLQVNDIADVTGRYLCADETFRVTFGDRTILSRMISAHRAVMEEANFVLKVLPSGAGLLTVEGTNKSHTLLGHSTLECSIQCLDKTERHEFYISIVNLSSWIGLQKCKFIDVVQRAGSNDIDFIAYDPDSDVFSDSSFNVSCFDKTEEPGIDNLLFDFPLQMEIVEFRQVVSSCLSGDAKTLVIHIEHVVLNHDDCVRNNMDSSLYCMITTFEGVDGDGNVKTKHRMLSMSNVVPEENVLTYDEEIDPSTRFLEVRADAAQRCDTDRSTRRDRIDTIIKGEHIQVIHKAFNLEQFDKIMKPMERGTFRMYLAQESPLVLHFGLGDARSKMHFVISPLLIVGNDVC